MRIVLLLSFCFCFGISPSFAADLFPIRVGVLQFGTVNWELDVLQQHEFDKQTGVEVTVVPLASKNAVNVALQGDAVDVVVNDWIWVSRQRASQRLYTAVPYSLTVGALMVRPDANIQQLADLAGQKLGIAGGAVDKSWLLFRAFAKQKLNQDLATMVEPVFGAPPLLNQLMLRQELPAVINFWHYNAQLQAAGMQPLMQVADILPALGIDTAVPLLAWVFNEQWANEHKTEMLNFVKASYQAKHLLQSSDEEWTRLRPLTKAKDDETLIALRDAYRAGIPQQFGVSERTAAAQLFHVLAQEGGSELVGDSTELSAGTFWEAFEL